MKLQILFTCVKKSFRFDFCNWNCMPIDIENVQIMWKNDGANRWWCMSVHCSCVHLTDGFTCVLYFPCHHGRPVMHLCCNPFVSLNGLHELSIDPRWMFVHSCRTFLAQAMDHSIRDAFESAKENKHRQRHIKSVVNERFQLRWETRSSHFTYKASQWIQAQWDLWDVSSFEQIGRLEDFLLG